MAKKDTATIDTSAYDYKRVRVTGADGKARHSVNNDDPVARALLTFTAGGGELDRIVRDNKLGDKYPKGAKGYANQGLFRMVLGGSLRALIKAGTPVKIGSVVVKSMAQRVADPSTAVAKPADVVSEAEAAGV